MFAQSLIVPQVRGLAKKVRWHPEYVRFDADLGAGFSLGFQREPHTSAGDDTDVLPEGQRPTVFPPITLWHPGQTTVEMTNSIKLNISLSVLATDIMDYPTSSVADLIVEWHREFQSLVAEHIPEHIVYEQPHHFTFQASPHHPTATISLDFA
jgi:hypothetical protein